MSDTPARASARPSVPPRSRWRGAAGLVAGVLYSNFLIDWVLSDFAGMDRVVSFLEVPGEAHATLLRVTDVVCVLLVVTILPGVRRAVPAGGAGDVLAVSLAVFALGAGVAALVPMSCGAGTRCTGADDPGWAHVHEMVSCLSTTAVVVSMAAAWWATRVEGPARVARVAPWLFWTGGIGASVVLGCVDLVWQDEALLAYSQRVQIVVVSGWLVCLGLAAVPAVPSRPRAAR